jgi:transcriptional regulator with XRE-family HTH domain
MKNKSTILLPSSERILRELGENIRLARLRRRLSTTKIAERANVSRATLWQIERGFSSVAMGKYLSVLFVLGFEKDLLNIAKDDVLGRKLQDANILVRERAPKRLKKSQ